MHSRGVRMGVIELLETVQFLLDNDGNKKAAVAEFFSPMILTLASY